MTEDINKTNPAWQTAKYESCGMCDEKMLHHIKAQYENSKYDLVIYGPFADGFYFYSAKEK